MAEAPRDGEVAGGNQPLAAGRVVGPRPEDVAGDLEAEELAPGEIAIEGVVDPIAVAPGMREGAIGVLAGGVGVADDIEPVAAPLHAVLRAREQPIDNGTKGLPIGRRIGEKGIDFLGRRREAGEIVGGAADERPPIGRGGRSDAGGVEPRLEEAVDFIVDGGAIGTGGHRHRGEGLEGPPVLRFLAAHATDLHADRARVGRARPDPFHEHGDLVGGEPREGLAVVVFLGGHRRQPLDTADRLEKERRFGLTGQNRRSRIPPLLPPLTGVEREAAAGLGASVALEAMGDQERPDLRFKVAEVGWVGGADFGNREHRSRKAYSSDHSRDHPAPGPIGGHGKNPRHEASIPRIPHRSIDGHSARQANKTPCCRLSTIPRWGAIVNLEAGLVPRGFSMPLTPLRRVNLAHDISAQLSQAIVAGDFPAGAVLSEPMLAKRLGVSRAPVREALIELETRGMVEFDERGRSRVPSLTHDDLVDILGIRIALEPRAAGLAARRADPLAFIDLERNLDAMRAAQTPTELARLDTAFHSGVVRASGSRRLHLCWNVVEHQVDLWLAQMQSRVDALCHQLRDTTVAAHAAMFETIRSGDALRAENLARKHLTDWLDVLPGAPVV